MSVRTVLCFVFASLVSLSAFGVTTGPIQNPNRTYPASCLSYPLSETPSGPVFSSALTVPAYNTSTGQAVLSEDVRITIWRVACADGKAALIGQMERTTANSGRTDQVPLFPFFNVSQGGAVVTGIRVSQEPNTFVGTLAYGAAVVSSVQFVFENAPNIQTKLNFSQAMTLEVLAGNNGAAVIWAIPAYDPSLYATANLALPITGYVSGAWYDPAHGGEGMLIQVYSNPDGKTRTFYAQWFTYTPTGQPFWLVAQGNVKIGDRDVTNVVTQYLTGGGFAGSLKANNRQSWGTMSFKFTDCNTLQFTYNGHTETATSGPSGSGSRTWTRLGDVNGAVCD